MKTLPAFSQFSIHLWLGHCASSSAALPSFRHAPPTCLLGPVTRTCLHSWFSICGPSPASFLPASTVGSPPEDSASQPGYVWNHPESFREVWRPASPLISIRGGDAIGLQCGLGSRTVVEAPQLTVVCSHAPGPLPSSQGALELPQNPLEGLKTQKA